MSMVRKLLSFMVLSMVVAPTWAQNYEQMVDSLDAATKMVEKFPEDVNLKLKKASWNLLLEQWDYAKSEYDKVLAIDPRYKFARKDYEEMLSIVPGDFNGQLGLALLLQKDLHYTEAMNRINRLVEQHPTNAVAFAARAGMEVERGMLDLAEYDFSEAMRLDPDNTDYIINRADVRIRMKHFDDARADLALAIKKGIPRPALSDLYARCQK